MVGLMIKIRNYDGLFRIVSLALDEATMIDLQKDQVAFLYIEDGNIKILPEGVEFQVSESDLHELKSHNNYDVYEIWPDGRLVLQFDVQSIENCFFITGKCNSNCIMCPSPDISRQNGECKSIDTLLELVDHIPTSIPHITITGGEPFLAGKRLFEFIDCLKQKYIKTEFLFLTNGRIFAVREYAELFAETMPQKSIVAIPIHGANPQIHDAITRADKSFDQTICGIKNLLRLGVRVEIRIVVSKMNARNLLKIAELIVRELPGIEYISVIAMEMTGNAFLNRDYVWITYTDSILAAEEAIEFLVRHGITVRLYNFPLCVVPVKFWTLCEKSISPDKIRYLDICDQCKLKASCGGIFSGTLQLVKEEIKPVL